MQSMHLLLMEFDPQPVLEDLYDSQFRPISLQRGVDAAARMYESAMRSKEILNLFVLEGTKKLGFLGPKSAQAFGVA